MEAGEKVAMQRIEFADRQTNGVVLAVRHSAHYARDTGLSSILPPL